MGSGAVAGAPRVRAAATVLCIACGSSVTRRRMRGVATRASSRAGRESRQRFLQTMCIVLLCDLERSVQNLLF